MTQIVKGLYKHYRHDELINVIGSAKNGNGGVEEMVLYTNFVITVNNEIIQDKYYVCPIDFFNERVEVDCLLVPRFKLILHRE